MVCFCGCSVWGCVCVGVWGVWVCVCVVRWVYIYVYMVRVVRVY